MNGNVEACMIAIACSEAPEGRDHWTLQMIADELVHLGVVDSISDTAVLYKAFEPAEAHRIAARLEIIYNTPVFASWLNMPEIEIVVLSRQCLSQHTATAFIFEEIRLGETFKKSFSQTLFKTF